MTYVEFEYDKRKILMNSVQWKQELIIHIMKLVKLLKHNSLRNLFHPLKYIVIDVNNEQKQSSITSLLTTVITSEVWLFRLLVNEQEDKKVIEKKLEEVTAHADTSYSLYQQVSQHFSENQKQLVRLTEENSELKKKLFVLTDQV